MPLLLLPVVEAALVVELVPVSRICLLRCWTMTTMNGCVVSVKALPVARWIILCCVMAHACVPSTCAVLGSASRSSMI